MAIKTSGSISLGNIQAEFGGTAPHSLSEYYYAGALVKTNNGGKIPSSSTNKFSNYYGASKGTISMLFQIKSESYNTYGDRAGYRLYSTNNNGIFTLTLYGTGDIYNIKLEGIPRNPLPNATDYLQARYTHTHVNIVTIDGGTVLWNFTGLSSYADYGGNNSPGSQINERYLLTVTNLSNNKIALFNILVGYSYTKTYAVQSNVSIYDAAFGGFSPIRVSAIDEVAGSYSSQIIDLNSVLF